MSRGPGPTDEAVQLLYEEARRRADAVTGAITEMEDRIEKTIRVNVLLLGLVLTGISLPSQLARAPTPLPDRVVLLSFLGAACLMGSTAIAVTAYLKDKLATGVDTADLYAALRYELEKRDLHVELLRVYRGAIVEDERVVDQASRRFRASLHMLLLGLGLLVLAALDLSIGRLT